MRMAALWIFNGYKSYITQQYYFESIWLQKYNFSGNFVANFLISGKFCPAQKNGKVHFFCQVSSVSGNLDPGDLHLSVKLSSGGLVEEDTAMCSIFMLSHFILSPFGPNPFVIYKLILFTKLFKLKIEERCVCRCGEGGAGNWSLQFFAIYMYVACLLASNTLCLSEVQSRLEKARSARDHISWVSTTFTSVGYSRKNNYPPL